VFEAVPHDPVSRHGARQRFARVQLMGGAPVSSFLVEYGVMTENDNPGGAAPALAAHSKDAAGPSLGISVLTTVSPTATEEPPSWSETPPPTSPQGNR
jgi:hypothetical protein